MVLGLAAPLARGWMGVVEANQPLTIRPVQRERIVDAVRLLRRRWYPRHNEPDPMATVRVHHENLPVEVEKQIERRIARFTHGTWLSH
jgi:hypothetical protein